MHNRIVMVLVYCTCSYIGVIEIVDHHQIVSLWRRQEVAALEGQVSSRFFRIVLGWPGFLIVSGGTSGSRASTSGCSYHIDAMFNTNFKDNFSSGVNFLRRRFSSSDLQEDLQQEAMMQQQQHHHPGQQQQQQGPPQDPSAPYGGQPNVAALRRPPMTSAPTSPSMSAMQGMIRAATNVVSPAQKSSPARDKCKILFIIDEPHTDWWVSSW